MTNTWTCAYCNTAYNNPEGYEHCRCEGMTGYRAERSGKPDSLEHERAAAEARERGMAFIVDGKHVNADRVMILSLPDTLGPISDMRRAKDAAASVLEEVRLERVCSQQLVDAERAYEAWKDDHKGPQLSDTLPLSVALHNAFNKMDLRIDNALDLMNRRAASMSRINEMLGVGDGPSNSVDESCTFTEAAVLNLVAALADARVDVERLDWFDKQRQSVPMGYSWSIAVDSGITNVRLAMDSEGALEPVTLEPGEVLTGKHQCTSPQGGFACQGCTCGAPIIPTIISSQGCGLCGVAFTGQGWVCATCAGAKS